MRNINTDLIDAMKIYLPKGNNLANALMDILYLGKEATYRRLRGEVPFTFAEVATISQHMGISLDKIVGADLNDNAIVNLNMLQCQRPTETYYSIIDSYIKLFGQLIERESSERSTSSNTVPQTLYLKYEALSKFQLFKWIYQHESTYAGRHYEDLEIPEKLIDKQKEFVNLSQLFQSTNYIWDKEIFIRLVNEVKFFLNINLISEDSVKRIKKELLILLNELEKFQLRENIHPERCEIYISDINFESTYSYVETDIYHQCLIGVFSINSITSKDDFLFQHLKLWIQSLKKYSTLISQSGEVQRIHFFNRQQELVKSL
ncbi:hypothetical protein ACIXNN_05375 [Bacteroides fragilis]